MGETAENNVITRIFEKGDILMSKGQPLNRMAVIISGTVNAKCGSINICLQPGAVIGIMDIFEGSYFMEYTALETVELYEIEYKDTLDLRQFFVQESISTGFIMEGCVKEVGMLINAYNMEHVLYEQICKYVKKHYERYKELCTQIGCDALKSMRIEQAKPMEKSIGSEEELKQYYTELSRVSNGVVKAFFENGDNMALRHLKEMSQLTLPLVNGCERVLSSLEASLNLLCGEDNENVFMLYMELLKNRSTKREVAKELLSSMKAMVDLREKIEQTVVEKLHLAVTTAGQKYRRLYDNIAEYYQNNLANDAESLAEQIENMDSLDDVNNMLDKILDYSQMDDEFTEEFREVLQQFCDMPDRLSTENADRVLRKKLTSLFYKLYRTVFFRAEAEHKNAKVLDLFLNFAIVDETMFQPATLDVLLNREKDNGEYPIRVYTIRQWLHEIYIGNKEPSRNEFDQDYQEYLRELNKSKVDISPQEMEKFNSREEKVKFEIKNFFTMNNRLTSGHLLTFCPVLSEEDLGENFVNQLMTPKKINDAFQKILSIDFSVFYRDVMYDDPKNGINKLTIHQQVMPDVICMPNAGTMGRMWQEISGRKRASAGRFTVPVVLKEDLIKVTVRMIGSFRWEICKRVQGNYWNDVSEPSLTSEFCDYIQFYKKNRDLSEKAKEKIGQLLTKCRNNYGEVFVNNYMVWVVSESAGNVRLDKVTRNIMGRYCPFVQPIRAKLMEQPMFTDAISRYERERMKRVKELNNRRAAIRNCNGTETEEFLQEVAYWEL